MPESRRKFVSERPARPGIRAIARLAGVSPTTVSFVLNDRAAEFGIAKTTVERVLKVVREQNYRPNFHGRAIMAHQTYLVGVILYSFTSSFWNLVLSGISRELNAAGYHMLLSEVGPDRAKEAEAFAFMAQFGVDGVICASNFSNVDSEHLELPDYWYEQRVVNVLHPLPEIPSVFTDNAAGAEMVARALWEAGHRRIAFLGWIDGDDTIRRNENWRVIRDFYRARGGEVLRIGTPEEVLRRRGEFTAAACYRDADAVALYETLQAAGVRIPEELSVAGYGGSDEARLLKPRLSTVEECKMELGVAAVRRLLAAIEGRQDPFPELHTRLMPRFRPGESIAEPRKNCKKA